MGEGDTLINAVIGAVVAIVLSFIPFSPVLGGAVAGYLQKGSRRDGIEVGAYAGVITSIPLLLIMFLFASVFAFLPFFSSEGLFVGAAGIVVLVIVFVFVILYGVALSALGGWIGNYVVSDTDL